jgi:hypothetical protein
MLPCGRRNYPEEQTEQGRILSMWSLSGRIIPAGARPSSQKHYPKYPLARTGPSLWSVWYVHAQNRISPSLDAWNSNVAGAPCSRSKMTAYRKARMADDKSNRRPQDRSYAGSSRLLVMKTIIAYAVMVAYAIGAVSFVLYLSRFKAWSQ